MKGKRLTVLEKKMKVLHSEKAEVYQEVDENGAEEIT